jgi:hypothetical protein
MTAVLEVYDQRPGAARQLRHTLDLPTERVTAREMIRRRIEAEVTVYNAAEKARFVSETATYRTDLDAQNDASSAWLVRPGTVEQALNGTRPAYGPRPGVTNPAKLTLIDSEAQIAMALHSFAHNGFFMIFDGRQILELDEVMNVERDSALTFLRLVQLVGG